MLPTKLVQLRCIVVYCLSIFVRLACLKRIFSGNWGLFWVLARDRLILNSESLEQLFLVLNWDDL